MQDTRLNLGERFRYAPGGPEWRVHDVHWPDKLDHVESVELRGPSGERKFDTRPNVLQAIGRSRS